MEQSIDAVEMAVIILLSRVQVSNPRRRARPSLTKGTLRHHGDPRAERRKVPGATWHSVVKGAKARKNRPTGRCTASTIAPQALPNEENRASWTILDSKG